MERFLLFFFLFLFALFLETVESNILFGERLIWVNLKEKWQTLQGRPGLTPF